MRDENGEVQRGGCAFLIGTILLSVFGLLTVMVLIAGDPSSPAFLPSIISAAVGLILIVIGKRAEGK